MAGSCMLQISTGPAHGWEVDFQAADSITVNGQPFAWDLAALGDGRYHILHLGKSYTAEVLAVDYTTKIFVLKINGQRIELQAKDRFDRLLDRMGLSSATVAKVNEVKAPMPGLIVDIRVQPGQAVQKGDPLLVLEAMKMENILKAPADGVVSSVKVDLRTNVTKGQVLIQFA
jgi:biotin carboxyl carrier protein